jgi:hypothetical protein
MLSGAFTLRPRATADLCLDDREKSTATTMIFLRRRMLISLVVRRTLVVCAIAAMCGFTAAAQKPWAYVPRTTAWGDPDLQGMWPSGSMIDVPFERPRDLGTRAVLTDEEAAQRTAQSAQQNDGPGGGGPPRHWSEPGKVSKQASLVIDPPDGRLPPLTHEGARRAAAWPDTSDTASFAAASDLVPYDRCITRGVLGSAYPNTYSSGTQILQSPGYVIIRHEMIHETRIVPLDGRRHTSSAIRSYMGDPRGHWEGPTLVVETTNFNGKTGSYGRQRQRQPDERSFATRRALHAARSEHAAI